MMKKAPKYIYTFFLGILLIQASAQSLDSLTRCALRNHPDIRRYETIKELAYLNLKSAERLYYPTLEANFRRSYNWGLFIDPATNILSNYASQVYSGSLYGEWEIFSGGRIYHTIEQNRQLYMASGFDYDAAVLTIKLEVSKLYFRLYTGRQLIRNAEFQLTKSMMVLRRMQQLEADGMMSAKDVLNAETETAGKELSVLKYKNAYRSDLLILESLCGLDLPIDTPDFSGIPGLPPDGWKLMPIIKDSLSPALKSLDAQFQASLEEEKTIRAAAFPTLTIGGGMTTRSSSLLQVETGQQFSNNLSRTAFFNLRIPIYNKGLNSVEIKKQQTGRQILIRKKEGMSFQYRMSELTQRSELINLQDEYQKTIEIYKLSQRKAALTEKAWEAGAATWIEWQLARTAWYEWQNKLTALECDFYFRKYLWEHFL